MFAEPLEKRMTLLTLKQTADLLQCSTKTVLRRFAHLAVDVGTAEDTKHHKNQRRNLRISKAALEKYLSAQVGHAVLLSVPEPEEPKISGDLAGRIVDEMERRQEEREEQAWQEQCEEEYRRER